MPWLGCSASRQRDRVVFTYPAGVLSLVSWTVSDEVNTSILRNAYEPLVDLSPDLRLVPCLASSWYNPTPREWVFSLREDVRLHDGRILTAEDVAAFLRRANQDPASRRSLGDRLEAIETRGEREVVLRTREPYGRLVGYLPAWLVSVPPVTGEGFPVGTGPYRVTGWEPDGVTRMIAFDAHRDGAPAIRSVEFRVDPPARAADLLVAGKLDLLIDPPPDRIRELAATPGLRVERELGLRVVYLGFNALPAADAAPRALQDVRVRRAVALALDRESIVQDIFGNHFELNDQLVPAGVFGYHDALPAWRHDPAEARRALAEAGYPEGVDLNLDYVPGRYPAIGAVAERVRRDLAAVGIRVALVPETMAEFRERVSAGKVADLFLLGWLNASGDAATTYEALVHSPAPGGFGLYSGYSNPEVDRLLGEVARSLELRESADRLLRVAEILHDEVAVVPLYRQRDVYAFREGLRFERRLDRRLRGWAFRWE